MILTSVLRCIIYLIKLESTTFLSLTSRRCPGITTYNHDLTMQYLLKSDLDYS
jgi:hypothetical protein